MFCLWAVWINDQHIWSGTGARGMNRHFTTWCVTLNLRDLGAINPAREGKGGQIYPDKDSWEKRTQKIEQLMKDMENGISRGRLDKIGPEDRALNS